MAYFSPRLCGPGPGPQCPGFLVSGASWKDPPSLWSRASKLLPDSCQGLGGPPSLPGARRTHCIMRPAGFGACEPRAGSPPPLRRRSGASRVSRLGRCPAAPARPEIRCGAWPLLRRAVGARSLVRGIVCVCTRAVHRPAGNPPIRVRPSTRGGAGSPRFQTTVLGAETLSERLRAFSGHPAGLSLALRTPTGAGRGCRRPALRAAGREQPAASASPRHPTPSVN